MNIQTIATNDLKPGDVIVQTGRSYNLATEAMLEIVDRYEVVSVDEPAEVLYGIAAGQIRSTVHLQRIMSNGKRGAVREQSHGVTVTIEAR